MAGPIWADRVLETSTTTGTGTYTLAGAVTGYQTFAAVGNANTCWYAAWEVDGNGNPSGGWEVGLGTYTSAGTTLSRVVKFSSNSNSAVNWSAGTRRIALVNPSPLAGADVGLCGGRLTLATGYPVYNPQPSTISSTDTGADTVDTTADHGYVTGTMVVPATGGGGLTAGNLYYVRAVDANTLAFYSTLANAEADTSRTNLTGGGPTGVLNPTGVQSTTVRFAPYNDNRVALYDGSAWRLYTFTELSLALGSVTSGLPYDIFLYDSSGTLTLEKLAWTNGTTRATALTTQDGVYVKSGDATRRYLGTIYTVSTAATADSFGGIQSQTGGKRYVWNCYNRVRRQMGVIDTNSSWNYTLDAYRIVNGASTPSNCVCFVLGLSEDMVQATAINCYSNTAAQLFSTGIGVDSGTVNSALVRGGQTTSTGAVAQAADFRGCLKVGYHYLAWQESSLAGGTGTFRGNSGSPSVHQFGLQAEIMA